MLSSKPAPSKLEKAVVVPQDKALISPIRSAFYGDMGSFNKNCLPFPNALTPDSKDTLTVIILLHFYYDSMVRRSTAQD